MPRHRCRLLRRRFALAPLDQGGEVAPTTLEPGELLFALCHGLQELRLPRLEPLYRRLPVGEPLRFLCIPRLKRRQIRLPLRHGPGQTRVPLGKPIQIRLACGDGRGHLAQSRAGILRLPAEIPDQFGEPLPLGLELRTPCIGARLARRCRQQPDRLHRRRPHPLLQSELLTVKLRQTLLGLSGLLACLLKARHLAPPLGGQHGDARLEPGNLCLEQPHDRPIGAFHGAARIRAGHRGPSRFGTRHDRQEHEGPQNWK